MMGPFWTNGIATLYQTDARQNPIPDQSVHCVVTSPPYFGLRVYRSDSDAMIGLEETVPGWIDSMLEVMAEVGRVLRDDGVLWVNLGDSYTGNPSSGGANANDGGPPVRLENMRTKTGQSGQLLMIPARFALAMQDAGWILRSDVIWAKKSCMPESLNGTRWERCRVKVGQGAVSRKGDPSESGERMSGYTHAEQAKYTDCPGCPKCADTDGLILRNGSWRCTSSHEHIFQFVKSMGYYSDGEAVKTESNANRRNVWSDISPEPYGNVKISRQDPVAVDAVSGGTKCKVSPDCLVHVGCPGLAPNGEYDAREVLKWSYKEHIGECPGQGPSVGSQTIGSNPGHSLGVDTEDGQILSSEPSAIDRSISSRRTGHAPETNPVDSSSAEIESRTDGRQEQHGLFEPSPDIGENNTLPGDSDAHSPGQTLGSNAGMISCACTSPCLCSFYNIVTEETSHYATFPSDLPRLCIQASTSEAGVCAECGSQWARVVEVGELQPTRRQYDKKSYGVVLDSPDSGDQGSNRARDGHRANMAFSTTTLSWRPTCTCNADKVPATVLDCFAGTGTTLLAAMRLGRRSVGVDLSPDYLGQAVKRLEKQSLPMLI